MIIRKATMDDLNALTALFDEARRTIAMLGIDQWQNGYPSTSVLLVDIDREDSFVIEIDGEICATFVLVDDGEPTYDRIYEGRWLTDNNMHRYLAIHRVAISLSKRGSGLSTVILDYAAHYAEKRGLTSLRIDTHEGNVVMRRMLTKHGFSYCGIIHLETGALRVAYEKRLTQKND